MKDFFSKANANCLDCPLKVVGLCYTHKPIQYSGFLSMLRSIAKQYKTFNDIPEFTPEMQQQAQQMASGTYVRFGTYGEPALHPGKLIDVMKAVATNHTGYTHQWKKNPQLADVFMASVHTAQEELTARDSGWRSFIATETPLPGYVNCPASKEQDYKSTCSKCGLCSGASGKGTKSVFILKH